MGDIYLSDIFTGLGELTQYKIHFAKNDGTEPLDAFMRGMDDWKYWNMYSNGANDFNRKYIFSLISFYPENDTWLFGGIWEVVDKPANFPRTKGFHYKIELTDLYKNFIGRLKIKYKHGDRNVRNVAEKYFPRLVVKELLTESYSTQVFPGYKNIDISFRTLEKIVEQDSAAWKNPLSVKGIYLITDVKSRKRYVGQAPGENGIWQRWTAYVSNGHGENVELKKLVNDKGMEYVRDNYKFTLLEIANEWDKDELNERESYWKRVLLSRDKSVGLNGN